MILLRDLGLAFFVACCVASVVWLAWGTVF